MPRLQVRTHLVGLRRPRITALRAELAELTGRTSVPNTFIAGEGIGGCNDGPGLMTLKENGKLVSMLQAAGVLE